MKRLTISIISAILALIVSVGYQYGYIAHNYSCIAYPDQCENCGEISENGTPTLGHLIIEAGGLFLKSNSEYQSFLSTIELSGIYGLNYTVLNNLIDNAIYCIEHANSLYKNIWETSKSLEYDPTVLENLYRFDYNGFQRERSLNSEIFKEVVNFLKPGNVNGIYERSYITTGDILKELLFIKANIGVSDIPVIIKRCLRINQHYLELELFGQYVSDVFSEL